MSETVLAASDQNLVWIDLEMTGLFPDRDRIIEIAVVVTDPQLNVRVEGPVFAVHQSDAALDAMDAWNKGTHGRSGLIDRVKASTVDEAQAEALVIDFLKRHVPANKSPMCGNSICQDRTLSDQFERAVGHQRRNLDDVISRGIEPRHLQVDPDKIFRFRAHAYSSGCNVLICPA